MYLTSTNLTILLYLGHANILVYTNETELQPGDYRSISVYYLAIVNS